MFLLLTRYHYWSDNIINIYIYNQVYKRMGTWICQNCVYCGMPQNGESFIAKMMQWEKPL